MQHITLKLITPDDIAALEKVRAVVAQILFDSAENVTQSEAIRFALRMAANQLPTAPRCPLCLTELMPVMETADDPEDAGHTGVWYCPECSAGGGQVVVNSPA